jgi:hypothetical protein
MASRKTFLWRSAAAAVVTGDLSAMVVEQMGAKFSPDSKEVMFVDLNASRLVIGELANAEADANAGPPSREPSYAVHDWK